LLYRQGDPGQRAYLIESGVVRFRRVNPQGIEREVGQLGAGQFFGETSLLLGEPHDATADVLQDVSLIYINGSDFGRLLEEHPEIIDALRVRPEVHRKLRAPRFSWQGPDESVIIRLHRHNVTLIPSLIMPVFILLVILAGVALFFNDGAGRWALIVGGILSLPLLLFILYLIVDHFNDDYILTNKRVVHEERVFIIREFRAEAPLHNIQNVQLLQEGLSAQIFDLGDLIIETAGEEGIVFFRQIPHPEEVQDAILNQIERVEALTRAEERAAVREALRQRFGERTVPVERLAEPEDEDSEDGGRRFSFQMPSWFGVIGQGFRYFVPGLKSEVEGTVTWRKHWVMLVKASWLPSLLLLVTIGILGLVFRAGFLFNDPAGIVGAGTILGVEFFWWLWRFVDWKNDVYQVTSSRIIDVERSPLALREHRREARLDVIQNVGLEIPSLLGRILKYGSVKIETASAGAFTFDFVKDPREVQQIIFQKMEAFEEEQRRQEARRRRDEMLNWFSVYDEMRHPEAQRRPSASPDARIIGQEETDT
jgi:uncharacterized membrane protein YdbT with pleckstrin-like domain